MKVKDMFGITVGASLLAPTLGSIGSAMTGSLHGIGSATQTLVAGGFAGHTASKVKSWFK